MLTGSRKRELVALKTSWLDPARLVVRSFFSFSPSSECLRKLNSLYLAVMRRSSRAVQATVASGVQNSYEIALFFMVLTFCKSAPHSGAVSAQETV